MQDPTTYICPTCEYADRGTESWPCRCCERINKRADYYTPKDGEKAVEVKEYSPSCVSCSRGSIADREGFTGVSCPIHGDIKQPWQMCCEDYARGERGKKTEPKPIDADAADFFARNIKTCGGCPYTVQCIQKHQDQPALGGADCIGVIAECLGGNGK